MKLRAPEGCGAVSHGGIEMTIGADGCVTVDECAAEALIAHGFSELGEDGPEKRDSLSRAVEKLEDAIDRLNRRGLFAFLKAKGVGVSLPITNGELRALARQVLESAPCDPSDDETEEAQ